MLVEEAAQDEKLIIIRVIAEWLSNGLRALPQRLSYHPCYNIRVYLGLISTSFSSSYWGKSVLPLLTYLASKSMSWRKLHYAQSKGEWIEDQRKESVC